MVGDSHRRLLQYLKEQTDDYLRGVGVYDADDYELLYLREDLRTERVRGELDKMVTRFRQESRAREQRAFPFGELTGTVRTFEEAMVMHYPHTQERGIVVTFEPGVGRDLNTFMHECKKRIEY